MASSVSKSADKPPVPGRDIFSRMLQMEKLSQVRGLGTSSPHSRDRFLPGWNTTSPSPISSSNLTRLTSPWQQRRLSSMQSYVPPVQPSRSITEPQYGVAPLARPNPPQQTTEAPSASFRRSNTMPEPSLRTSAKENERQSGIVQELVIDDDEDAHSPHEICHSPSWPDHGADKHKKEQRRMDKEKKESEKKDRKDDERQKAALHKATKRLSKRPPAAMETQRMPAALANPPTSLNSGSASPSQDTSRHTSKEDRRSSFSSLSSLKRFSRTSSNSSSASPTPSPSSWKRISDTVPQLGRLVGIESRTRKGSASTQASKHSEGDEACLSDIVSFACQLEASRETSQTVEVKKIKTARFSLSAAQPRRSETSSARSSAGDDMRTTSSPRKHEVRQHSPRRVPQRASREDSNGREANARPLGAPQYPSFVRPRVDEAARKREIQAAVAKDLERFRRSPPTPPDSSTFPSTFPSIFPSIADSVPRSSQDGGSYVHKQRVSQQRRSISGYEDEMAIRDAIHPDNRSKTSAHGKPKMPPTPDASSESIRNGEKGLENNLNGTVVAESGSSGEETTDGYHKYLTKESLKSNGKSGKENKRLSKTERMLGDISSDFSAKPAAGSREKKSDQAPKIPDTIPVWSPLMLSDMLQGSGADDKENQNLPDSKVSPSPPKDASIRSSSDHSRSRTNSSQILSQDIRPLALPRSSTSPALKTTGTIAAEHPSSESHSSAPPLSAPAQLEKKPESTATEDNIKTHSLHNVKPNPEVVVEGVDGDGLVRRTSIKRPRSDPNLLVSAANQPQPSLDFLPQLKHQPLTKPKRSSPSKVGFAPIPEGAVSPASPSQTPRPSSALSLSSPSPLAASGLSKPKPPFASSPTRHLSPSSSPSKRNSMLSPASAPFTVNNKTGSSDNDAALATKPLAKMFVICCKCKFWHDLPSKLYEAMALPRRITTGDGVAQSVGAKHGSGSGLGLLAKGKGKGKDIEGKVFTEVRCPWCEHGMSTVCCAGWTAIVYLHQRHH